MSFARWQATIVDEAGDVQSGATVTVRDEATGNLAALKDNRAGSTGKANPTTSDADGFVYFYVTGGAYRITATKGAFTREWRHEGIGTAKEVDIEDLAGFAGFPYQFDTGTGSNADAGTVRANQTNLAAATEIYVAIDDQNGNDNADFLVTVDDSTSAVKGYVALRLISGGAEVLYRIDEAEDLRAISPIQDVIALHVTHVSGGSITIDDAEPLSLIFQRSGDQGNTGEVGPIGPTGATGSTGEQGIPGENAVMSGQETVFTNDGTITQALHNGNNIVANKATPITLTLDAIDTSPGIDAGFMIQVLNIGAGACTVRCNETSPQVDFINGDHEIVLEQWEGLLLWCNGTAFRANQFSIGGAVAGALLAANNLSDVASAATAFANIKQAASTAATGVVELATDTEVQTGTATDKAMVPSNLQNRARFSAHKNGSNQTGVLDNTMTKVTFDTELFDIGGHFDTTNSRWVPPAGVPVIIVGNVQFLGTNMSDGGFVDCSLFKNGSAFKNGNSDILGAATGTNVQGVWIDVPNGTDYYEFFARADGTASNKTIAGTASVTYFWGSQI